MELSEFKDEVLEIAAQFVVIANAANECGDVVTSLSAFASYNKCLDVLQEVFGGANNGGNEVCST